MTPLIVTARMKEPVVYYGDGMHLDGILAYGAFKALSREEREALPSIMGPWALDFDLPLERWEHMCLFEDGVDPRLTTDGKVERRIDGVLQGTVWGWKASAAIPDGEAIENLYELRKKPELGLMSKYSDVRSHHVGMGPMRAKDLKYPSIFARTFHWYARGNMEIIEDLLSRVHAIGKLTKQGPGRVMEWVVEKAEHDYSMIDGDGRPTRTLPSLMFPDEPYHFTSIRAPYHHPSRRVWCVEPR